MNSKCEMTLSMMGTAPVVMFRNTSTNSNEAWVCETAERAREAVAELEALSHITDVRAVDAVVKEAV